MILLGCIPDAPDSRDLLWRDSPLLGAGPRTGASSWDWSSFLDEVQSQIGNSCVGQSIASAAYLAAAIAGTPIKRPSALFPYAIARLLDAPGQPLMDFGCRFRLAMMGLREHGLVANERWPETPETINTVPPLDAFEEGECATLDAFYRIDGHIVEGMKAALARGYCPLFGMPVDSRYESTWREVYDAPGGSPLGNHGQVVTGYSAVLDAFRVLNSWGRSFGDDGFSWISASFINAYAFDPWVIKSSPQVTWVAGLR